MRPSYTYKALVIVVSIALVAGGMGFKLFDEANTLWGFFSEFGSEKIMYDGAMTRRYWLIYDICIIGLWGITVFGAAILIGYKGFSSMHHRALKYLFYWQAFIATFDIIEVVATTNNYSWSGVEIVLHIVSMILLAYNIVILFVPAKMQEESSLKYETAILVRGPFSWLRKVFGQRVVKIEDIVDEWEGLSDTVLQQRAKVVLLNAQKDDGVQDIERNHKLIRSIHALINAVEKNDGDPALFNTLRESVDTLSEKNKAQVNALKGREI